MTRLHHSIQITVIPAQAGIHSGWLLARAAPAASMDSRLRGNDEWRRRIA